MFSSPQDMSSREKSDNGKEVGSETNLQERATAQTASDTGITSYKVWHCNAVGLWRKEICECWEQ